MKPRRALMPKTHLIRGAGSILFPGLHALYLHQPLPFMHPFRTLLEQEMWKIMCFTVGKKIHITFTFNAIIKITFTFIVIIKITFTFSYTNTGYEVGQE